MKRIAFCLLWLLLALPLHAQEYDYVAGAGGAALSCDTVNVVDSQTGVANDYGAFGSTSTRQVRANKFTTSKAYTVCAVSYDIYRNGSSGSLYVKAGIWEDNGSGTHPKTGAPIVYSNECVAQSSFPAATGTYTIFTFTNTSLTNGVVYWPGVAYYSDSGCTTLTNDSTNNLRWSYNTGTAGILDGSTDLSAWNTAVNAYKGFFKTYEYH